MAMLGSALAGGGVQDEQVCAVILLTSCMLFNGATVNCHDSSMDFVCVFCSGRRPTHPPPVPRQVERGSPTAAAACGVPAAIGAGGGERTHRCLGRSSLALLISFVTVPVVFAQKNHARTHTHTEAAHLSEACRKSQEELGAAKLISNIWKLEVDGLKSQITEKDTQLASHADTLERLRAETEQRLEAGVKAAQELVVANGRINSLVAEAAKLQRDLDNKHSKTADSRLQQADRNIVDLARRLKQEGSQRSQLEHQLRKLQSTLAATQRNLELKTKVCVSVCCLNVCLCPIVSQV